MTKQVRLELDGDLAEAGFRVTLEIRDDWSPHAITLKRSLPASATLATVLENHWRHRYRALGAPYRIKTKRVIHKGTFSRRWEECKLSATQLQDSFNEWLQSESFQPIYDRLQQELHPREEIHFLIRSNNPLVHKLPWSAWKLFEAYPKAEPALSPVDFEPVAIAPPLLTDRVNVLVILGHSEGIDVTKDMEIIQQLPHVRPRFLIEPRRTEISEELWRQPWDIIFFAGHSVTEDERGVIYINPDESITVDDLWLGLRQAVRRGLQLAIFNSCDGLGLARRLNDLNIPQMVVMRELVPDRVAQQFLSYFLPAFASGESLYQAVRSARERLDEAEEQFPCASWLPVLCQNPTSVPPRWQDLYRLANELEARREFPQQAPASVPSRPRPSRRQIWQRLAVTSLAVTLGVMGIRWLGWLQMPELLAYDQLMRSRPTESLPAEILLVEATPEDTEKYGYPLEDRTLAELLNRLQASKPAVIGVAMHRAVPRGEGREQLIKEFENNNLITICSAKPETDTIHGAPTEIRESQVSFSDLYPDQETFKPTVRRQSLSYLPESFTQASECTTPYSFSLRLAHKFLQQQGKTITTTDNQEWQLGDVVLKPLPKQYGGYQQLNGESQQILLNYQSTAQPAQQVTLTDILESKIKTSLIRDRIVIVGTNNPNVVSFINTPYGEMAQVRVQAHMVSQLVDLGLGRRIQIWAMPIWCDALLVLFASVLGGTLALRFQTLRRSVITTGIALFLIYQICLVGFIQSGWLPLVPAAIAIVLTAVSIYLSLQDIRFSSSEASGSHHYEM